MKTENDFENPRKRNSKGFIYFWTAVAGGLGVTFVLGAVFYIWLYIQQTQNGYRLAKLYEQHEQLLSIERKLRLEWCQFQDPFQLEELGRKQFGLAPTRQDQKILMR